MVRTVQCPTCRTPVSWQGNPYRPFCSARCRTIDLGSWADESYRIPGEQTNQEESPTEAEKPAPSDRQTSTPHAHSPNRSD